MAAAPLKAEFERLVGERGLRCPPRVLMAASECAPLASTGGLAEAVGTLPKYLNRLGVDTRVILPYHSVIRRERGAEPELLFRFEVSMGQRRRPAAVYRLMMDKVCVWLIENDEYFSGPIYLPGRECEQYAFFTRAVLEALPRLDFIPDIIHCNDWHTGMIPLLLKTQYIDSPLSRTRSLMTVHNIAYQGLCGFGFVQEALSVPDGCFGLMDRFGQASFLKAGMVMADRVNTVSPTYAREICTPAYGMGLEGVLNQRKDVRGILPGIERGVWNPGTDRYLPVRYGRTKPFGKLQCKTALLGELGLEIVPHRPMVAMITRLEERKGVELIKQTMDRLLWERDFAFALLGTGHPDTEHWFRGLEARHRGRACSWIGQDEAVAHRLYAGADFLLLPSRFEPGGTSQLIAMAYGTLPIARETGGLKDTVLPYNRDTGAGTGITFARFDPDDMADAVCRALNLFQDRGAMSRLMENAMAADYSCEKWAFEYAKLFLEML